MFRKFRLFSLALLVPFLFISSARAQVTEVQKARNIHYNRGFEFKTDDGLYRMRIGGYIQPAFDVLLPEGTANSNTFRLRRARLLFEGSVHSPKIRYNFLYDFAPDVLLNAFLDLEYSQKLIFRMGQFVVPFDAEAQTSSGAMDLVDRSIMQAFFGVPGFWEPGVSLRGYFLDHQLDYHVSVTNGEGLNNLNNNKDVRYTGRLTWNMIGHPTTFTLTDASRSPSPALSFAAAGMFNKTINAATTLEDTSTTATGELMLQWRGWGVRGSGYYRHHELGGSPLSSDDLGGMLDLSYLLKPIPLEIAARYAQIFADGTADLAEYTAGFIYHIVEYHRVKASLDYSALTTEDLVDGGDQLDHRIRFQLQVSL